MTREEFMSLAGSIPHESGCYKYFDKEGNLLYVGKAKNLRKRVGSYFATNLTHNKTRLLVDQIHSIEFTVTPTEHDAFLLENSLIKHHQPKFNISLKDDKTYPYVVIKKEPFPRVFLTRQLIRDGSEYLGPFSDVGAVKTLMELISQSIPLRTCRLNLAPHRIARGKYKVCLEYHLGNCLGPCEGKQTEEDYEAKVQQVRHILRGNTRKVIADLEAELRSLSQAMEYEKAAQIHRKIQTLKRYQSKSTVVHPRLGNLDVVHLSREGDRAFVHYMMVASGSVVYSQTTAVDVPVEEEDANILSLVYDRFRERYVSQAPEVLAPMTFPLRDTEIKITRPKAGDKKVLLDLAARNMDLFRREMNRKRSLRLEPDQDSRSVLESLQQWLHLPVFPEHIECFDNSNIQGAYPVSAMVCFRQGRPSPKDYRHYHIRTVEGIDDFATMREVVHRRYRRLLEEEQPLPDLVIIDGGKGQLNAALDSLRDLGIESRMAVVGLAKKEELLYFPGDKEPLSIPFDQPAQKLIRHIRDEVHRFGLQFHRKTRSKGMIRNELESIGGIGKKTAQELLAKFRSVKSIKQRSLRELTQVIGQSRARKVYDYFHGSDSSEE